MWVPTATRPCCCMLSSHGRQTHTLALAQVLVTYGRRVLSTKEVPDAYSHRYKGVWVCLSILTRALSGNYVNFGVFDLYGDPALKVRDPARQLQSIR